MISQKAVPSMAHERLVEKISLSNNTNKKGLMKMSLLQQKVLPTLTGKKEATVKDFEEVENTQGGYVKVILQLEDRDYTYCIFPTQVEYVTSCLRNQLGLPTTEETTLGEVLQGAKETPINVWFSYNNDLGRMNVAFHEPKSNVEADVEL